MAHDTDAPTLTDHQVMLYAALQLIEAQDAGKDTTHERALYDQCRARVEDQRRDLEGWIAAGAHLTAGPTA